MAIILTVLRWFAGIIIMNIKRYELILNAHLYITYILEFRSQSKFHTSARNEYKSLADVTLALKVEGAHLLPVTPS